MARLYLWSWILDRFGIRCQHSLSFYESMMSAEYCTRVRGHSGPHRDFNGGRWGSVELWRQAMKASKLDDLVYWTYLVIMGSAVLVELIWHLMTDWK